MTVEECARQLRAGQTTSVEVTARCLARIADENPKLNAFILVMAEAARAQAAEADRELKAGRDRGPLHGVPVSIKDLVDIAGTVSTAASRVREGLVAPADAPTITRLRQAGAVIVGKTNLHEFAFGTTSEDSAFGIARHPLDQRRSPGGSSGGSAISVATGMALASLGSDTGGSIRIPSAACGIVGLKPTIGEVPTEGVVPLSHTYDHLGPITQTVTDAWIMLHALRANAAAGPLEVGTLSTLRFGVLRRYFCDLLEPDVRVAFDATLARLTRQGATLVDVEIPHSEAIAPVYAHTVNSEAAAYHAPALDTVPDKYSAPIRLRLETARYVLAEDYVRALNGRVRLQQEVDAALSGVDGLVLPTLPIAAPLIGVPTVRIGDTDQLVRSMTLRLTQLFNITGHPAISLPCGTTSQNLPVGFQVVGVRGRTDRLLQIARAVEMSLTP